RKDPLTLDHLRQLVAAHPDPSHNALLFLAITFVGFFGLHRLGELTDADRVNLRDPRKTIGRARVRLSPHSFRYFLPGHKGDRFFEGNTVIIAKRHDNLDPLALFKAYISSRDKRFPYDPALFLTASGSVPTRAWFLRRLRKFFPNTIAGHSLRAGGATFFASEGWPDDRIQ
ncbi:hypothetical protein FA95DRAFT_1478126, partial [Auriscalpium vulgare]